MIKIARRARASLRVGRGVQKVALYTAFAALGRTEEAANALAALGRTEEEARDWSGHWLNALALPARRVVEAHISLLSRAEVELVAVGSNIFRMYSLILQPRPVLRLNLPVRAQKLRHVSPRVRLNTEDYLKLPPIL
jgi:hypothetical protein